MGLTVPNYTHMLLPDDIITDQVPPFRIVGHQHAFMLRMLGLQYYGAQKHLAGTNDGMIWDKVLRCGVEFEKSTRDQQNQDDILFLVNSYKTTFEFLSRVSVVESSNPRFQEWYKHFDSLARKVRAALWQAVFVILETRGAESRREFT